MSKLGFVWESHPAPLECGCSLMDGRCARHGAMMTELHAVYFGSREGAVVLYSIQDGYGQAGFVPEQGFDWSGVRDSSTTAIEAMHTAVHS